MLDYEDYTIDDDGYQGNGNGYHGNGHNGYDQLNGGWGIFYKVAKRFNYKVKREDSEDFLHDLFLAFALRSFIIFNSKAGIWHIVPDPDTGHAVTIALGESSRLMSRVEYWVETLVRYQITENHAFS